VRVDWAGPAVRDLESIWSYIARDSEYYADRFAERIVAAVENLTSFPELGRVVPEVMNSSIREVLFQNYRLIYRVEPDRILVVAVMHAARDWSQKETRAWDVR
jgi:plasmid stabilization system protein ParE